MIIRVWGNILSFREYLEAILGFGKDFFSPSIKIKLLGFGSLRK